MRRSGKLSVRARLCAHGCAYGPLYGMWLRVCVRRCAHARACVYACVYWCRLGSWDQRALLGPSSEDTLRSTPARLLHALPLLVALASDSLPSPLRSTPRFYSACLGTHGRGIVAGRSRRAACRSTVL